MQSVPKHDRSSWRQLLRGQMVLDATSGRRGGGGEKMCSRQSRGEGSPMPPPPLQRGFLQYVRAREESTTSTSTQPLCCGLLECTPLQEVRANVDLRKWGRKEARDGGGTRMGEELSSHTSMGGGNCHCRRNCWDGRAGENAPEKGVGLCKVNGVRGVGSGEGGYCNAEARGNRRVELFRRPQNERGLVSPAERKKHDLNFLFLSSRLLSAVLSRRRSSFCLPRRTPETREAQKQFLTLVGEVVDLCVRWPHLTRRQ